MRRELATLKADVEDEMAKIGRLAENFASIEPRLDDPPEKVPFYDRAAIGYYLHGFYNGCENIFVNIARFFENDLDRENWPADVLRRMRLEIPGFRPAVIEADLYGMLEDLRRFRHVYRRTYDFELDWEKERAVAKRLQAAARLLREQVAAFLAKLDDLETNSSG